jgi:hypothetical protein
MAILKSSLAPSARDRPRRRRRGSGALPKKQLRLALVGKTDGHRFATIQRAAGCILVNPATIRQMIADGRLRGYRGAGWRILTVDLNELAALIAQVSSDAR